jgi:UDP-N-acetylenolpyruvoylglucosamine reductase
MWTFWTNNTCNPTNNRGGTCTLGHLPEYVIMAKTKEHIKAGVDFARTNNVRLLIRNTGHDFMGRSAGYGSLAINTHSFKSVEFVKNYTGPGDYKGSAVTVGAGVQVRELYRLANQQSPKVVVVGGECPTVGLAGGYIQVSN